MEGSCKTVALKDGLGKSCIVVSVLPSSFLGGFAIPWTHGASMPSKFAEWESFRIYMT